MAATITAAVGRIDWGYFTAAAMTDCRITNGVEGWMVRGACLRKDPFNLKQRGLVFVVPTTAGEWRWPVLAVAEDAGALTARLGDPLG